MCVATGLGLVGGSAGSVGPKGRNASLRKVLERDNKINPESERTEKIRLVFF